MLSPEGEVELEIPEGQKIESRAGEGIGKWKPQKPSGGDRWTYCEAVEADACLTARAMDGIIRCAE